MPHRLMVTLTAAFMISPLTALAQRAPQQAGGNLPMSNIEDLAVVTLDVPYAQTDNPRQKLDIYLPKHRSRAALPVILFLHGGGWLSGSKADTVRVISQFLPAGQFAAVAVGYRLSTEAKWPAQIHDCKAAVRWVRANASKYGFDPDKIGVWGASAGGHLALMLGVTGDRQEFEGELGSYRTVSSKVSAVADFIGITDLPALGGQGTGNAAEQLIGAEEYTSKAAAASPISYVAPNVAPVLIVHGTADHTVPYDQAVRFDAALRKVGGTSYFVTIQGGGHGNFGFVANDRVDAFFDKYLRGKSSTVDTTTITDWKPLF